jgi:hypothetical protein
VDNCPPTANNNQADQDGDDLGDVCDPDLDGDGDLNEADNCPFDANSDQADADGDGAGDVCDSDLDGDGVHDAGDACVPTPAGEAVNPDGCSISQLCPCPHPVGGDRWKNHGAYMSCLSRTAGDFVAGGLITEVQKGAIEDAGGESLCGRKGQ